METHGKRDPSDAFQEPAGSRVSYERYLPEALALTGELAYPRTHLELLYYNAGVGVAAVLAERARLEKELPALDLDEVAALPELVLAVIYADSLIDPHAPKPTRAMQARAAELRQKLLTTAEALVLAGLFPAHEVARIRAGHGAFDTAADCVALARLFQDHAVAIQGKSPVTAAEVKEAAELGASLYSVLRPRNAPTALPPEELEAIDHRNRLWTLAATRYERVRRAGAWLFGVEHLDDHVPALGAHKVPRKKAAEESPTAIG